MLKNKKGFTLIELLVVIAIIGLLSTLAVVSLNNARQKSRDAKRVSDIKQVQTALELFFVDQNGYPGETANSVLGSTNLAALDDTGFTTACGSGTCYMGQVPSNPTPNGADYVYNATSGGTACTSGTSCDDYSITFTIEGPTGQLTAPNCTADPNGISCTGTF